MTATGGGDDRGVETVLRRAAAFLQRAGIPDARLEAELLLGWCLGVDRGGLVARRRQPVADGPGAEFADALARRAGREPLQHITGAQEFHGLAFRVDRRVLIPRPETEGVVDAVLELAPPRGTVADLGTGSGCIAITVAVKRPDLRVCALDIDADALDVARHNAARHAVGDRIDFVPGTMASPPADWLGAVDVVASNPPYVSDAEWRDLQPEVRDHEPRVALVPGRTGLEAYRAMAPAVFALLRVGGVTVVELGHDSEVGAREAFAGAGFVDLAVQDDLAGIPRVLTARKEAS